MALTALDPKTALVVIDLQKGIVSLPTAHPTAEVIERASRLADAFRRHRLPVVLVHVVGAAPGVRNRLAAWRAAHPTGRTSFPSLISNPQIMS
jgi:nicotinamidase-related amidase